MDPRERSSVTHGWSMRGVTSSLLPSTSENERSAVTWVSRLRAGLPLPEMSIVTKPFAIHHHGLSLIHLDGTCRL